MKCTDNSSKSRRARNKRNKRKKQIRNRWVACLSVILMIQCIAAVTIYKGSNKTESLVQEYETSNYTKTLYRGSYLPKICVQHLKTFRYLLNLPILVLTQFPKMLLLLAIHLALNRSPYMQ